MLFFVASKRKICWNWNRAGFFFVKYKGISYKWFNNLFQLTFRKLTKLVAPILVVQKWTQTMQANTVNYLWKHCTLVVFDSKVNFFWPQHICMHFRSYSSALAVIEKLRQLLVKKLHICCTGSVIANWFFLISYGR